MKETRIITEAMKHVAIIFPFDAHVLVERGDCRNRSALHGTWKRNSGLRIPWLLRRPSTSSGCRLNRLGEHDVEVLESSRIALHIVPCRFVKP